MRDQKLQAERTSRVSIICVDCRFPLWLNLNLSDRPDILAGLAHSQFSKARTDDRTHRGLKKLIQKAARLCIDFLKPPRGRRRDGAKNENLDSKEREPESETQQMTENVEKTRRRLAREARRHAWRGRGVSVSTGGGEGL